MKKLFVLFFSCLLLLGTAGFSPVFAADIRSGDEVAIPSTAVNLKDLYLFGGTIRLDAPVTNDVVAAGGNITISKQVTGSAIVAGGNISISGPVNNTIRAAGGNIRIENTVAHDLVVTGGSVTVTKNASIGGDVIFSGGKLLLEGPIKGKAIIYGGEVTINSAVGGDVTGEIGKLSLGQDARINGNLSYKSEEKAQLANGAAVKGNTSYTPAEKEKEQTREFITAGGIYQLITDILLSVLFIFFFTRAVTAVLTRIIKQPVQSGAIGFAFILFFPLAALILFILIWLGVASLLSYALVLLVSLFIAKVFLGWWVFRWWENRDKKTYRLDWKAGVLGPIILFVILAIPFIGWLAAAILMAVATGAVLQELFTLMSGQKVVSQKAVPQRTLAKKR